MSKSYVQELLGVLDAIGNDIKYSYPALAGEIDRDIKRLRRSAEQRGLYYLVESLPAVGKHLDRCLASGQYNSSGLPTTSRVSGEVRVPKLFRALYLLVFEGSGRLRDDYDAEAILFLRQLLYVGKKAEMHCGARAVKKEILDFMQTDASLPSPEEVWESSSPLPKHFRIYRGFKRSSMYVARARKTAGAEMPVVLAVLSALDFVSARMASALGRYDYRDWRFRHGPGVVSTSPRYSNKYYWTAWPTRLENAFPLADCGFHNYASWADGAKWWEESLETEFASRLIDVPKTYLKPRLIASEPGPHQWCQQNIWHYFRSRCASSWISNFVRFTDQSRNQELCRRGSVTGDLTTLDLSAASDRITCHAVGQLFRTDPGLLLALHATRTRFCELPQSSGFYGDGEPVHILLRKFATMGNACTFPVESLMFLCVAIAGCLISRHLPLNMESILGLSEEVTVFGDDIVVPTDCWELVALTLEVLHFKVNTSKSYSERPANGRPTFRESCGVDAFGGVDVTPTYWRSPCTNTPESIASSVEVSNNFQKKFLLSAARRVASTISVTLPQIPMDSGILGLKAFVPSRFSGKRRFNEALQRSEFLTPMLLTKVKKTPSEDDTALLQFFTERPSPLNMWKSGTAQRPELKIRLQWVPSRDFGNTES